MRENQQMNGTCTCSLQDTRYRIFYQTNHSAQGWAVKSYIMYSADNP